MTLADFVEDVAERRKTFVVHASDGSDDVAAQFATRNVAIEHEPIPADGPEGFVVLRDEGEFVGAFSLEKLRALLDPPLYRPEAAADVSQPWRALYEVLEDTLFASFDRRQLLAATREIEERAWRTGAGTLRVGFQSVAALADQVDLYRRFVADTNLTVHVYVADDTESPPLGDVDLFRAPGSEIGEYWFLAYEAPADGADPVALVAQERDPDAFFGFWTYDRDRVADLSAYLRETYE